MTGTVLPQQYKYIKINKKNILKTHIVHLYQHSDFSFVHWLTLVVCGRLLHTLLLL